MKNTRYPWPVQSVPQYLLFLLGCLLVTVLYVRVTYWIGIQIWESNAPAKLP